MTSPNVWGSAERIPGRACSSNPFKRQEITQRCLSKSGETFRGTTAGDAPATGEQTEGLCLMGCWLQHPFFKWVWLDVCEKLCSTSWASGTGYPARKSGQCRLHPLLAWWGRGGKTPFHHSWEWGWRKFSVAGAQWGLALWAEVSGLCMLFRGCICILQRTFLKLSRCGNRQYIPTLGEPAGIIPLAFTLLTHPFSVLCLTFSPSRCCYGTHLPGGLRPLSMLWANENQIEIWSIRNPSRNMLAKAVFSENGVHGCGFHCVLRLTLFIIPNTFKSSFLCTSSMTTKTLEPSQPLLLTSALSFYLF